MGSFSFLGESNKIIKATKTKKAYYRDPLITVNSFIWQWIDVNIKIKRSSYISAQYIRLNPKLPADILNINNIL